MWLCQLLWAFGSWHLCLWFKFHLIMQNAYTDLRKDFGLAIMGSKSEDSIFIIVYLILLNIKAKTICETCISMYFGLRNSMKWLF